MCVFVYIRSLCVFVYIVGNNCVFNCSYVVCILYALVWKNGFAEYWNLNQSVVKCTFNVQCSFDFQDFCSTIDRVSSEHRGYMIYS